MKLIIINSLPTSKIFGEKVDAWWYQEHSFDVAFWDITPLFWSQEKLNAYYGGADDYRYVGPGHKVFSTAESLLESIHKLAGSVAVWHLGWNLNRVNRADQWLLDAIVDAGLPLFIKQFETNPVFGGIDRLKQLLREMIAHIGFRGCPPTGFIGCGSVAREQARRILPDTSFVSIPSPKILWERSEPVIDIPYAVFVDENVEYAPDAKMLGFSVLDDIDGYYRRMNVVFRLVEEELGCPVVVAASGKYRYIEDRFQGRALIYGQTLPLIQHAKIVIGHCSGALDQAIVDRKPLLRLDDPSFEEVQRKNIRYSIKFSGGNSVWSNELESIRRAVSEAACDERLATEIEAKYFKETGVDGDYRDIIKQAFLSV